EFEPHVTIFSTSDDIDAQQIVDSIAATPLQLHVTDIAHSEEFTKMLFVQFAKKPALSALSEALRIAAGSPDPYALNPHLSLIYKELPEHARAKLAEGIELPFEVVNFDRIVAIGTRSKVENADDVRDWEIVARREL